jgi:hypothetical protein
VSVEERLLGPAGRVGVVLFGLVATGAGLFTGFYAVTMVATMLSDQPVQPWPMYGLGLAMLAFPLLLLAMGFLGLGCRDRGRLRLIARLAAAAVADVLLAVWLVRMPTQTCLPHPPSAPAGVVGATGCLDRSWSPPS